MVSLNCYGVLTTLEQAWYRIEGIYTNPGLTQAVTLVFWNTVQTMIFLTSTDPVQGKWPLSTMDKQTVWNKFKTTMTKLWLPIRAVSQPFSELPQKTHTLLREFSSSLVTARITVAWLLSVWERLDIIITSIASTSLKNSQKVKNC